MSNRYRLRLKLQGYMLIDEQGREVLRFHERLEPQMVEHLAAVVVHSLWFTEIDPWKGSDE